MQIELSSPHGFKSGRSKRNLLKFQLYQIHLHVFVFVYLDFFFVFVFVHVLVHSTYKVKLQGVLTLQSILDCAPSISVDSFKALFAARWSAHKSTIVTFEWAENVIQRNISKDNLQNETKLLSVRQKQWTQHLIHYIRKQREEKHFLPKDSDRVLGRTLKAATDCCTS